MSKLSSVPYDVSKHLATFMNQSQSKAPCRLFMSLIL